MKSTTQISQEPSLKVPRGRGRPKPHAVSLDDILVEGDQYPLVPDGEYVARFLLHETAVVFRTPKVFLHFELVDFGRYFKTQLWQAYRVRRLIGTPGKGGRFALGRRSELFLDLARLYDKSIRPDRISLSSLKDVLLRVRTRTVTTDYKQRPLPEHLHYSVIDSIMGVEIGSL